MLLIKNSNKDAYHNMALEEYLLKEFDEDIFMVWQNENAIVVGRSQDANAEIDDTTVKKYNIQVVRRLSGGGAVYHDLGNVNYTYIMRKKSQYFNDYSYFSEPICAILRKLGVAAELSGKNDVTVLDKKISGTAQAKNGEDVLFHGTLLIDSDLKRMQDCLRPEKSKLLRHGITSIAGRVANLKPIIGISAESFMDYLCEEIMSSNNARIYTLNDEDNLAIERLIKEKYTTDEWNYGFKFGIDYEILVK